MTEVEGASPSLRSNTTRDMEAKLIEMYIDDALIEKPYPFSVESKGQRERHFFLYPVTLGKLHLLKRHMENLEINFENMKTNPHLEALRIVETKKDEVCKIIAYHTMKRKKDVFDTELVQETSDIIKKNATDEDLATLLIYLLTKDDVESFKSHLGITKENERMRRVSEAKRRAQKSSNDFEFGGKSIYGTLIDLACERYGWPYDYVIWGISLVNLQLMLADRMQSIYVTDEEKKKIQSSILNDDKDVIKADDKANMEKILAMDWR